MPKKTNLFLQLLLVLAFTVYMITVFWGPSFWSCIFSPLGTYLGAFVLFYAYRKMENTDIKIPWLLAGFACLTWAVSDTFWAYDALIRQVDPEESILLMYLYLLPNFSLALAAGLLLGLYSKALYRVQLLLDIMATSAMGLAIIWIILFRNEFESLLKMNAENWIMFIYALCDMFILGCLVIWFSAREGVRPSMAMRLFIAGLLLYALADLYYTYQYFYDIYDPNTLLDAIYLFALLLPASGALLKLYLTKDRTILPIQEISIKGNNRKGVVLLLGPVLVILLTGFRWQEVLFLVSIVFIHQIISSYIANARINEQLLAHEKKMNLLLEEQIAMRTKELIAINRELEIVSNHDSVTSFYNRRYFMQSIDFMMKEAGPEDIIVLFFIDLDRFKSINDAFGHDVGDQVLIEVANRMRSWNVYDATMARLGGDEFVFAIRGKYQPQDVSRLTQALIRHCSEPIAIASYQFQITMSVGITVYPTDAQDRSTLMKNADIAMYYAKSQGCNQYAFYSAMISEQVNRKTELEMLLRNADYDREFELHFQPQYSIPDRELTGFEALLHWNNPTIGPVPAIEFIPIAEEIGCIITLGDWVLREAAQKIKFWNEQFGRQLRMSVNISPRQLVSSHFIEYLQRLILEVGVLPEWLDLEIVESVAIQNESAMADILFNLSGIGVSLSIDEFGLGYSSLINLKRFAIDRLKIAKPLIENIAKSERDCQIIKAVIQMAKAMGIQSIAEGVESEAQMKILNSFECNEAQGFLLGHPLNADQLAAAYLGQPA